MASGQNTNRGEKPFGFLSMYTWFKNIRFVGFPYVDGGGILAIRPVSVILFFSNGNNTCSSMSRK